MLICRDALFDGLSSLWQSRIFSDIEIHVGRKKCSTFLVHKVILSAHSPFFLALFTSKMKEIYLNNVSMEAIEPTIMQDIFQFMYTGCLELTADNCCDILYAADMFLMRGLVEECCEFMYQHMDVNNCVDIMLVADAHSCSDLKNAALTYICQNLAQLSTNESFLALPFETIMSFLDSKELPCLSEVDVLKAVLRWIVHDVPSRKRQAFHLLSTVRFASLTVRDLDLVLLPLPKVQDKAFAVIMDSLRADLATGKLFKNERFCKPKRGSKFVLLFGGMSQSDPFSGGAGLTSVFRYDTANSQWIQLENFRTGRYKHAVSLIGNRVYLLGGYNECFAITASVECYNITTGSWSNKCPMLECRRSPHVTTVNGRMFLTSSEDSEACQPIIEVYDAVTDKWSPYTSNLGWLPATCSSAKVHGDKLYEWINGNKQGFLRVTRLYVDSDLGSRLDIGVFVDTAYPYPPLSYTRHKCAMAFIGDHLYLLGGFTSASEENCNQAIGASVDRLHLSDSLWERVAPMSAPRAGHSADTIEGKIFVFGGQHDRDSTTFMEVFDPALDSWEKRPQPINFMFAASVIY